MPAILVAHCYFPTLDRWMAGLVILPYAVPSIVLALGLLRLYSGNYGVVLNGTPWVLIFGYMPLAASLYYMPIKNNLRALQVDELFEAGRLSAPAIFIMWRIVLPCVKQGLIIGLVMNFTLAISDFVYANLLVGGHFPTLADLHGRPEWRQRPHAQRAHHHLFRRDLRGDGHRRLGDIAEKRRMSYVEIRKLAKALRRRRRCSRTSISMSNRARSACWWGHRAAARPRCCARSPGSTHPDSGRDPHRRARRDQAVEAKHRGVGMVFQHYALFPNMTVEQNLAFGLRAEEAAARLRSQEGRRRSSS